MVHPRSGSAFRADPEVVAPNRPSRRQATALLSALVLVSTAIALASFLVRPDEARSFQLVHGSVFLADQVAPVGIDIASGKPTLRLVGAEKQVGLRNPADVALVPVHGGTLLLNPGNGEFNMVDQTGFVIKHDGGGVVLTKRTDQTTSVAVAAAGQTTPGAAFIERTGVAGTDVFLINELNVQAASLGSTVVKPRASTTIDEQAMTGPGAAASGNGDLWMLMGPGDEHELRRLRLPANSSAGAALDSTSYGTTIGPAAIGTVPVSGRTPGNAVGVASNRTIQIFGVAGRHVAHFTPVPGLRQILPVSNAQGALTYLLHGDNGWSVVSVKTDGSGVRGPVHVTGLPKDAALAPPAASEDAVYSIDRSDGHIYKIDADGKAGPVSGAATYPVATRGGKLLETPTFSDAYVVARSARVLIDSPIHTQALALFTDGSRGPLVIHKSAAVAVSAAGGAEALTRNPNPNPKPPSPNKSPTPAHDKRVPTQPVNNHIDCHTTKQTPHIPLLEPPTAGSRSINVAWTYPSLDSQDCIPSTYVVSVKTDTPSAPSAPGSVTVQGQNGVTVTGLFPNTQYSITVTAYINGAHTTSAPIRVATGPQGPAAPTNVRATADAAGNWTVSWTGCGTVSQGCVQTASWQVIPSFCDGLGLSSPPAPLSVSADNSTRVQPPVIYRGSDALLGRGMQFLVQGTGTDGQAGTPSARSACVFSHAPPDPTAMTLNASTPDHTALGVPASTNLTLNLGGKPIHAVGGVGATVLFHLTGGGTTRDLGPFTVTGRANTVSATFDGVQAGSAYTATADVTAPHGGSTVTLTAPGISTRADWPTTSLNATCPSDGADTLSCSLHVTISGVTSPAANGETFDFHGSLQCGATAASIDDTGFDPANHDVVVANLSQLNGYYGTCTVSGTLSEHSPGPNPVFGGTTTTPAGTSLDLGTAHPEDNPNFNVNWDNTQSIARIHYAGTNPLFGKLTTNWSEQVQAPDATACGSASTALSMDSPDASVAVQQSCVNAYGDQTGWKVVISYNESVTGTPHSTTLTLTGTPPGYLACAPSGFQAAWGATLADGVAVSYNGDVTKIANCTNFSYVLRDSTGAECGRADNADPTQSTTVHQNATCIPSDGWSVRVTWLNKNNNQNQGPIDIALGSPPTA